MAALFQAFWVIMVVGCSAGRNHDLLRSPCGNWIPYKNEQCVTIAEHSGLQTKLDAEMICQTYDNVGIGEEIPKLVTVKTKDKQDFLQKYIFDEQDIVDNVWLGLDMGEDGLLRWNDGSDMIFSNWKEMEIINETQDILKTEEELHQGSSNSYVENATLREHNCVEMEAGEGVYPTGTWVRANCKARLLVVCEKTQIWSVSNLQNILLDFKLAFDRYQQNAELQMLTMKQDYEIKTDTLKQQFNQQISNLKKEAEERITTLNQQLNDAKQESEEHISNVKKEADAKIVSANKEVNTLKHNPVPIGYIYVQLPDQQSPTSLWPIVTWIDTTAHYSGLFFRAEGGDSAAFGQLQSDNTRRVGGIHTNFNQNEDINDNAPTNGEWSTYRRTGSHGSGNMIALRYWLTTGEIRPRNKAVRIWKRTG